MKKEGKNKLSEMERIQPAFPDCDRCIVFCADNNFMPLTSVAIQSLVETRNLEDKYDVLLFHSGVDEKYVAAYERMFGGIEHFSLRFVNIQRMVEGKSFYVKNREGFSQEAYYRLFTPWILDEHYHRALYLDGDMIVRQDIMRLFRTDVSNQLIAAVRDYCGICNCYIPGDVRRTYRKRLGLMDIDDYVISSTILFNLDEWRKQYSLESVLAKCVSKKWMQHDQDVLNVMCFRRMKLLSPIWGFVKDPGLYHYLPQSLQKELSAVADPAIYHFAADQKPYYGWGSRFDSEFWTLATHTVYLNDLLRKCTGLQLVFTVLRLIQKEADKPENCYSQVIRENLAHCTAVDAYGQISRISTEGNTLHIEGHIVLNQQPEQEPFAIRMTVNGDDASLENTYTDNATDEETGEEAFWGANFSLDYKLNKGKELYVVSFSVVAGDKTYPIKTLFQGRFSPLTVHFTNSYYYSDGWIVQQKGYFLAVSRCSRREQRMQEARFLKELNDGGGIAGKKAVLIRPLARRLRQVPHKPIWLISDRVSRADDNGEVFFRYVNQELKNKIDCYFVIDRKSPDYKRLQQYGKVVPLYSYRHKLLSLVADWIVVSQTDDAFRNPFRGFGDWYADLLSKSRVAFLDHGVISPDKDISSSSGKTVQQFDGFVVSAKNEYDLVRYGRYHYNDSEIWLTGLPRFDDLEDRREKLITILPTWRMNLTAGYNNGNGFWDLRGDFAESEYATFYRNLMQHPRLRAAAEQNGYTVQFKVHPSYSGSVERFGFDPEVQIVPDNISYRDIFSKSSLMVTDYSSAIYDFLYLRKPVFYCQFDKEEFYHGHVYSNTGEVNYERDGFGEVEYDLESTVDRIIQYMENGCQLRPKYRERIDNYFAFRDRNNCKRVAGKLLELSEKQQ